MYAISGSADHHEGIRDAVSPQAVFEFPDPQAARDYIEAQVDVPVLEHEVDVEGRVKLHAYPQQLSGDRFTNVYDLSFAPNGVSAKIRIHDKPESLNGTLARYSECIAAASGAFLYLADKGSGVPRQTALNLALREAGVLCSVPVVDQEALIADERGLSLRYLRACGDLMINGRPLTWSGSRTQHETDCTMFGNGNVVIHHATNGELGARKERIRILDEQSRYTPPIDKDGMIDAGLIAERDGKFDVMHINHTGGTDLFSYDTVMRCERRHMRQAMESDVRMLSVDSLPVDGRTQGAFSVGPSLLDPRLELHPINYDPALGSDPPFIETSMVRLVLYASADDMLHLRLFDGRPESDNFRGVTPGEVTSFIRGEGEIIWGCFLDPGRTAKLCARNDDTIMSYGNKHYLQWPCAPGGHYTWVPDAGRPIPSSITLE